LLVVGWGKDRNRPGKLDHVTAVGELGWVNLSCTFSTGDFISTPSAYHIYYVHIYYYVHVLCMMMMMIIDPFRFRR